jgi:type IV pilus assembly protein PilN
VRVRLNLATKPLESHRRFLVGSGLAALVAGLVFVLLAWHVYTVRKANAELRARTEETRQKMLKLDEQRRELEQYFAQKDIASLHDRAAFLNSIIDARSFDWTRMFMDLERVLPGGVHVVSIEPKQAGGHVELKLTVGAANDEAELKFLRALEESSEFSEVQVQSVHIPASSGATITDQKIVQLTTVYSRI